MEVPNVYVTTRVDNLQEGLNNPPTAPEAPNGEYAYEKDSWAPDGDCYTIVWKIHYYPNVLFP